VLRCVAISVLALALSTRGAVQPPVPSPGEAVERVTVWRQAGVTSLALGNGVDVHLRSMIKPGNARVAIAALVPGIELDETAATRGSAMLAIDALKPADGGGPLKLRVVQRPEGMLITAACTTAELEGTLRQLAATLADPVVDPDAFEKAREKAVAQSALFEGRADHNAAEAMLRLMTPADDARLRRPARADFEAVKLESAAAMLKRHTASTAIDVAIVGDVDVTAIAPLVTASLGTLPPRTRDRLTDLRSIKRAPPPGGKADAVTEGPRAMLSLSLPAPAIADLGDARLASVASRLMERQVADALRDSGLKVSLASGSAMTGRTYPELGAVIGSFLLAGDDAHLRAAAGVARKRLAALVEDGPSRTQLQRAIDDTVAEIAPRIDSADYWSQSLVMAWFLRVPIDELGTAPTAINATTSQRLRQHMAKWWKPEETLTVTILPAAKPLPAAPVLPAPEPPEPAP
jgi:hypothetical protein